MRKSILFGFVMILMLVSVSSVFADDYVLYDDFETGSINASLWSSTNDPTASSSQASEGTYSLWTDGESGSVDSVISSAMSDTIGTSGEYVISYYVYLDETGTITDAVQPMLATDGGTECMQLNAGWTESDLWQYNREATWVTTGVASNTGIGDIQQDWARIRILVDNDNADFSILIGDGDSPQISNISYKAGCTDAQEYKFNPTASDDTYWDYVEIWDYSVYGWEYSSASTFNFSTFEISNSLPIFTNDVLDLQFNVSDSLNQSMNISITWFTSSDNATWTPHSTDNETWLNQDNATYNGNMYHTSATGDIEAVDTSAWEYWMASGTITIGDNSINVNSSSVLIDNNPVNITSTSSGTTNSTPVEVGEQVTFTVSGKDEQSDVVYLKVCENSGENWSTCTELCENAVGVTFDSVSVEDITCDYTTDETARNNTGYAIVYDGGNYTYTNISFYVNQYPTLSDITYVDTDGGSTFFFGESMDYFKVSQNDSDDGSTLTTQITVYDPDGVVKVDNVSMTEGTGIVDEYLTDLDFDAVGNWNVSFIVTDNDGASTTLSELFTVSAINLTTQGRVYGYDFGELPSYTTFNDTLTDYDYYLGEVRITTASNWSADVSPLIQSAKNESKIVILTMYDDLSNVSGTIDYVTTNFADLVDSEHFNGMRSIKLYLADSVEENASNSLLINNVTKRMFQNVSNKLPIYIRGYNHTDINTNYARVDDQIYITATTENEFVNAELTNMKASTSKTRIYYNLTDSLKTVALNWQNNIIDELRSTLITSTYLNHSNVIELANFDVIVINNETTTTQYDLEYSADAVGYDIYNLNSQAIVEMNTDGNVSLNLSANSGAILYRLNLSKIEVEDDNDIFIYSEEPINYPQTTDFSGASANAFQFVSSSANPDDARLILTDPSYEYPKFYVWYGTNGAEAIANWSVYDTVIIADYSNTTWAEAIASNSDTYGYTSVNTYGNNNQPAGCTPSVNCTEWNRTVWINDKKSSIETWTNMTGMNVFIDGLDIGAVNDVDGLFDDALIELTDYIKISKDRNAMLNTYTEYEDYANLGDATMRESACARWDGTVASPTYTYEDIATEVARANFHRTHNVPVFAQAFGNITDYDKSYYCFMQTKVLYGDLASYGYNQPNFDYTGAQDDFQWNYFKYPEIGSSLQDDYEVDGDIYSRRFENGIVSVNTSSHTVDYQTDIDITNMQFCSYYYDNDDGASDEGYMHYVINDNISRTFNVVDTDLTAFVKTWKCANISTDYFEPSGFYELEFYYIDSDGNYLNNNGLYMYHDTQAGSDRLSFYDQVLNDHPSNDETDYTYYATSDNWAMNFTIDAISSGTAIDQIDTVITRAENGTEEKTISFSSTTDWNLSVYDKLIFMNKTLFNGITAYNGSTETYLNYTNSSTCITSQPSYGSTEFEDGTWNACYWDDNGATSGYYVRVVVPHLSEQNYTIDGNTPPSVTNESIDLVDLNGGNQSWTLSFNYTDADGNTINTCGVTTEDGTFTESPVNSTCEVTIDIPVNSTEKSAYVYVLDEYDKASTDGTNFSLAQVTYENIDSSTNIGNLTIQYFLKYYNITQNQGNFSDISFDYEGLDARTINISDGYQQAYLDYSTNLINYGNYSYTPDGANTYTVNSGETVIRYFNITGNLSTGEDIPAFNISLEQEQYTSGTQTMAYNCGSFDAYTNFTSGSNLVAQILDGAVNDSNTSCYQYTYQGKIVYTDTGDSSVVSYDSGGIRYYSINNSDGNGYGRKISFMFDDLRANTTVLNDFIDYSTLTNWNDRITGAEDVWRYDGAYNLLTSGVDYTYTDVPASTQVQFTWDTLTTPVTNLYTNLTWSYTIPDDGGDDGGGGGGGGGSSPPTTTSEVDLTKVLCDISVVPSQVYITDGNPVVELIIQNRETVSYTPEYEFKDVMGEKSIQENVQLTNEVGTVLKNSQKQFGVQYKGGLFGSVAISGKAELVLSNSRCRDIVIPIDMDINATNIVSELISGDEPLLERVTDFVNEPVSENVSWSKLWILIGLLGILFGAVLWDKQWSSNEVVNWLVKGFAWFFLVGLSTGLIVMIIRALLGG